VSLMKKSFLIALVLLSVLFVPVVNAKTETFVIGALSSRSFTFDMNKNQNVKLEFSVKGGSGNDIDIKIYDPTGEVIYQRQRTVSTSFTITAEMAGKYEVEMDNSFSLLASKEVTLTYEFPVVALPEGTIPAYPIASIIMGLLVVFTISIKQGRIGSPILQ